MLVDKVNEIPQPLIPALQQRSHTCEDCVGALFKMLSNTITTVPMRKHVFQAVSWHTIEDDFNSGYKVMLLEWFTLGKTRLHLLDLGQLLHHLPFA